jgi:hypothetical protein
MKSKSSSNPRRSRRIASTIPAQIENVNAAFNATQRVILHDAGQLTSSGGGTLIGTISLLLSDFNDYSNFTDHFDEYRIIGGRCTFYSALGPGHTYGCSLMPIAYDHDSASFTPSSADQLVKYGTSAQMNMGRDAKFTYLFEVPRQLNLWHDCASPATTGCIAYYAANLANSTVYSKWDLEILVEFRGRR